MGWISGSRELLIMCHITTYKSGDTAVAFPIKDTSSYDSITGNWDTLDALGLNVDALL